MSEAKIEIKIGDICFSGEGDQNWLSQQLDKILDKAEELIELAPAPAPPAPVAQAATQTQHQAANFSNASGIVNQTLATFLKSKNATTAQVDKFLATAAWVEAKENKTRLKTGDIGSALSKASQSKINNPSDKLNQNVAKGYCEKDGKDFFVTQEGKGHMGL
jgi:hypothetical protein